MDRKERAEGETLVAELAIATTAGEDAVTACEVEAEIAASEAGHKCRSSCAQSHHGGVSMRRSLSASVAGRRRSLSAAAGPGLSALPVAGYANKDCSSNNSNHSSNNNNISNNSTTTNNAFLTQPVANTSLSPVPHPHTMAQVRRPSQNPQSNSPSKHSDNTSAPPHSAPMSAFLARSPSLPISFSLKSSPSAHAHAQFHPSDQQQQANTASGPLNHLDNRSIVSPTMNSQTEIPSKNPEPPTAISGQTSERHASHSETPVQSNFYDTTAHMCAPAVRVHQTPPTSPTSPTAQQTYFISTTSPSWRSAGRRMSLSDPTAGQTCSMQSVRSQQDATNSSDHSALEVQKSVQAAAHHVVQESERELNQQASQGNGAFEQKRESATEEPCLGPLRDSPQRITTTGVYVQASKLESPIIPSESPVIRPILKKSTSATQLNSTMAPDTNSILDSFKVTPVHSPVPNISSKFNGGSPTATRSHIHTSKSAPNLSKTPDWMPEYRRSGRRDSVKSLCFDNAIKKVCVFSSDESPARIAQSPRYVIESSDEGSSPESDIEEILGSGSFDYFDDCDDFTEGSLSKKPITKIYEPWVVNSRSHKFPNLTFPAVTLDSLMLSSSKSNTILSPSSTPNPTSGSHSQQPQRVTATILIRNIAYSKFVLVRYTSDGWKSFHDVEATYQGVVIPSTSSTAGIDRFMASIDLDKISPPVPAKMNSFYEEGRDFEHEILNFEFAVCGRMNGTEYWDNNCGRNHELILRRGVRLMPLMSAATAALMTASKGTLRTVEAVIEAAQKAAVQTAKAVAEEAKAIERDFEQSSPYRRNSLPSPTLELETVPDTRPARAQFTLNSVSRTVTAGGTPVMRRKAGILGGGGWGNGLYSLCAPSFSDDDDDDEYDDQDTIVPEKPATIVPSHIQEYHSDWAFGSHHATSASVESGGDSDSATATYPPPWALQRPAQYQSDTLYSLSSRAGSPVSLSTELSAFPSSFYHHHQQQHQQLHQQQQQQQNQTANNLYNHGHTLLHRVQHYQQQKNTPVKHDLKAELQKHDLKLDTFKIGKMFGNESFFHTQKSASSSFESASTLADSPSDSLSSIESDSGRLSGGLHLKYDAAVSTQQQENVTTKFLRRSKSTDLISRQQQPSRHPQQHQQQQHKKHMWDSRVSAGDLDTILGRTDEDDAEDMKRILDRKVMQSIEGWSLWDADGENDE